MDIQEIVNIVLPIVFAIVGVALVWFVIELALVIRRVRKTVGNLEDQIKPTLDHVEQITADLEPAVAKADPIMDRASLTVDAVNLEIMRVDEILEDVTNVTDGLSSAVDVVENVTNAPANFVNSLSSRLRNAIRPRQASDETKNLGKAKSVKAEMAEQYTDIPQTPAPLKSSEADVAAPVVTASDTVAGSKAACTEESNAVSSEEAEETAGADAPASVTDPGAAVEASEGTAGAES